MDPGEPRKDRPELSSPRGLTPPSDGLDSHTTPATKIFAQMQGPSGQPTPPTYQDLKSAKCVNRFEYVPHPIQSRFLIYVSVIARPPSLLMPPFSPASSRTLSLLLFPPSRVLFLPYHPLPFLPAD